MMSCSVLHHIEVCVRDEASLFRRLTHGFGFHPFAFRHTRQSLRWALKSGGSIFIITKRCSGVSDRGGQLNGLSHNTKPSHSNVLNCKSSPNTKISEGLNHKENGLRCPESVVQILNSNAVVKESIEAVNGIANTSEILENKNINNKYEKSLHKQTIHSSREKSNENLEHWTVFCCQRNDHHKIDSVFNIALVVKDVDKVTDKVRSHGGKVIREPDNIHDRAGRVRYSIVASPCGNIVHTLIDKMQYKGDFLPGYKKWKEMGDVNCNQVLEQKQQQEKHVNRTRKRKHCGNDNTSDDSDFCSLNQEIISNNSDNMLTETASQDKTQNLAYDETLWPEGSPFTTCIDHVACACDIGQSQEVMKWYEDCFGMKRFITNRLVSLTNNFHILWRNL